MILVFGCRQSEMDHIYKEETIQARNKGVFKELYTVYSREPGKPKVACQGTTSNPSLPPADWLDELMTRRIVIQYQHWWSHDGHMMVSWGPAEIEGPEGWVKATGKF